MRIESDLILTWCNSTASAKASSPGHGREVPQLELARADSTWFGPVSYRAEHEQRRRPRHQASCRTLPPAAQASPSRSPSGWPSFPNARDRVEGYSRRRQLAPISYSRLAALTQMDSMSGSALPRPRPMLRSTSASSCRGRFWAALTPSSKAPSVAHQLTWDATDACCFHRVVCGRSDSLTGVGAAVVAAVPVVSSANRSAEQGGICRAASY
ncbi:hypothetical protein VFPFJ_10471 [Purpureocillium lilacinum]|uniref:Uncharacterized protein n=1 Tax=Purpureocillium lilacinum TaxID=33203 RepID=A0A179GGE6_PURLI|nr:hypothetical protein VFPFJ_10471 [Purpureocillium lilacinum]OAQ76934.1 hypothetical protein VFPFJ_10471 [Purpureocillium lilacinum]